MESDVMLRLKNIGRAYHIFLQNNGLRDEHLARMTYFSEVKKAYVEDPLVDEEEQAEVIDHLDRWLEEIRQAMNKALEQTSK